MENETIGNNKEVSIEAPEQGNISAVKVESSGKVAGLESEAGTGGETDVWQAKNIEKDTVSGGSYTVTAGDTLWEIAEGRYGSGFEWNKILEANKDKIGFLPNGSQALISIGQVLVLPN